MLLPPFLFHTDQALRFRPEQLHSISMCTKQNIFSYTQSSCYLHVHRNSNSDTTTHHPNTKLHVFLPICWIHSNLLFVFIYSYICWLHINCSTGIPLLSVNHKALWTLPPGYAVIGVFYLEAEKHPKEMVFPHTQTFKLLRWPWVADCIKQSAVLQTDSSYMICTVL